MKFSTYIKWQTADLNRDVILFCSFLLLRGKIVTLFCLNAVQKPGNFQLLLVITLKNLANGTILLFQRSLLPTRRSSTAERQSACALIAKNAFTGGGFATEKMTAQMEVTKIYVVSLPLLFVLLVIFGLIVNSLFSLLLMFVYL